MMNPPKNRKDNLLDKRPCGRSTRLRGVNAFGEWKVLVPAARVVWGRGSLYGGSAGHTEQLAGVYALIDAELTAV